jgi:hypothetical protein
MGRSKSKPAQTAFVRAFSIQLFLSKLKQLHKKSPANARL